MRFCFLQVRPVQIELRHSIARLSRSVQPGSAFHELQALIDLCSVLIRRIIACESLKCPTDLLLCNGAAIQFNSQEMPFIIGINESTLCRNFAEIDLCLTEKPFRGGRLSLMKIQTSGQI